MRGRRSPVIIILAIVFPVGVPFEITFPVMGTGSAALLISPSSHALVPLGSNVTFNVNASSIPMFGGWDIVVKVGDASKLHPVSINLVETFSATIQQFTKCVNGSGLGCDSRDGFGVAHYAAASAAGSYDSGNVILFSVTFNSMATSGYTFITLPSPGISDPVGTDINITPDNIFGATYGNSGNGPITKSGPTQAASMFLQRHEAGYDLQRCNIYGSCSTSAVSFGTGAVITVPSQTLPSGDGVAYWVSLDWAVFIVGALVHHDWIQAGYAFGVMPDGTNATIPQMYYEYYLDGIYRFNVVGAADFGSSHTFQVFSDKTCGSYCEYHAKMAIDGTVRDTERLTSTWDITGGDSSVYIEAFGYDIHQASATWTNLQWRDTVAGNWINFGSAPCYLFCGSSNAVPVYDCFYIPTDMQPSGFRAAYNPYSSSCGARPKESRFLNL